MSKLCTEKAKPCSDLDEDCEYVTSPLLCWADPFNQLSYGRNPNEYCPEVTKYLFEAADENNG